MNSSSSEAKNSSEQVRDLDLSSSKDESHGDETKDSRIIKPSGTQGDTYGHADDLLSLVELGQQLKRMDIESKESGEIIEKNTGVKGQATPKKLKRRLLKPLKRDHINDRDAGSRHPSDPYYETTFLVEDISTGDEEEAVAISTQSHPDDNRESRADILHQVIELQREMQKKEQAEISPLFDSEYEENIGKAKRARLGSVSKKKGKHFDMGLMDDVVRGK